MKKSTIVKYYQQCAEAIEEVNEFSYGWAADINETPSRDYPLVLLTPIPAVVPTKTRGVKFYDVLFFVVMRNIDCTEDEIRSGIAKAKNEEALEDIVEELIEKLVDRSQQIKDWGKPLLDIVGDTRITPNDQLTIDGDTFVEVRHRISVNVTPC